MAIAAAGLGLAGLHRGPQDVDRTGRGAHIVLVLDRSLSMDQTFASRSPDAKAESKTAATIRLVENFFAGRPHDLFSVVVFSTAPILAMPLTGHRAAVAASLDAMRGPALAHTDIGRGLGLAIDQFHDSAPEAPNVILFVSDGAGTIDRPVQELVQAGLLRAHAHLYYLYLRTEGDPSLFEASDVPDSPASLNRYFEGLGVPYRAFEADNPTAIAHATAEINRLEARSLHYTEQTPRQDFEQILYAIAALCLALLVLARLAEREMVGRVVRVPVSPL